MRRPSPDGFLRQRARGIASLLLLSGLTVAMAAVIAWIVLVVLA